MLNVSHQYAAYLNESYSCVFCCFTAVSLASTELKCDGIAFVYNGSWNSPDDDGCEAVIKYCYGHIKGRDASCSTSSTCQLNSIRAVDNALEGGTSYVFYVYVVICGNRFGNGNC